jgi:cytochrome c553
MITKEKVKKEIDRLSDTELEKVYLYLSSLRKTKKTRPNIRSLKLKGKLDDEDLRSLAYE